MYFGDALDLQEEYREEIAHQRGLRQRAELRAESFESARGYFVADITNGGDYDGDVLGEVYDGPFTKLEADARAAELNAKPHASDLRFGVVQDLVRAEEEQWKEHCAFVAPPTLRSSAGEPMPVTPRRRSKKAVAA